MKTNRLKEIVELVAVFSIVASLIFVGLQVKQEHEIALTDAVTAAADSRKYMAELISDNREVWVSGLAGEPLTDLDKVVFAWLADAYTLDIFASWYRASQLNHTSPDRFPFEYASYLIRNPGLLAYWREANASAATLRDVRGTKRTGSAFDKAVEEALEQLQGRALTEN